MIKNLLVVSAAIALLFTGFLFYADLTWFIDKPLPYLLDTKCPFDEFDVINKQQIKETTYARAFVNYKPVAEGAILLLPKRHVERLEDLTPEEWADIHELIVDFQKKFKEVYGKEDYVLVVQAGYYGGQTTPHAHMHMIPRGKESTLMKKLQLWNIILTDSLGKRKPMSTEETRKAVEELK